MYLAGIIVPSVVAIPAAALASWAASCRSWEAARAYASIAIIFGMIALLDWVN